MRLVPLVLLSSLLAACAAPRPMLSAAGAAPLDFSALPPPPPGGHALNAGTGFFIRHDGTLLTATHVVENCRRIDVGSDTVAPTTAELLLADASADLAVLRAPGAAVQATLSPAEFASPLETLEAFGYPPEGALLNATRTRPLLLNELVRRDRPADLRSVLWLQDHDIEQGWSGGPVLEDRTGRVVGVTLAFVPDPQEMAKVLDRAEPGVAKATGLATIREVLHRAGVAADPAPTGADAARRAVVRVFCWH